MHLIISLAILTIITLIFVRLYLIYRNKISFFVEGMNLGFSVYDLNVLWQCAVVCNLEETSSLFYSMPSLTKCISQIKTQTELNGTEKMQKLLSKLYTFRTKIENDADKKRGLDSTRFLDNGQKFRIILPGKGVFTSELMNNGSEMIIRLPTQQGQITVEGSQWTGKTVNVYLWRAGDARYVFDTQVTGESVFLGKPCLHLKHTHNLLRTQKRNAVRAKCHISSELYILTEKKIDYNKIETKPGYKCIIEDISEKGALIRIGGKGLPNFNIRLQFQLYNKLVVMFGIIRTVEYNEELKQSRLHFECIHIEDIMRNQILSYVYNILPQNEKEIFDAMAFTDEDEKVSSSDDNTDSSEIASKIDSELQKSIPNYYDDNYDYGDNSNEDNEDFETEVFDSQEMSPDDSLVEEEL